MTTIRLIPMWAKIMPSLIAMLQNGTDEEQDTVRAELMCLAGVADQIIKAAPEQAETADQMTIIALDLFDMADRLNKSVGEPLGRAKAEWTQ